MPQITIDDVDDGSQYDVNVRAAPGAGDVLLVHDPGNNQTRLVLRVTGRMNGAAYVVERVSTAAASIMLAESA
jgi:hypothetical protein